MSLREARQTRAYSTPALKKLNRMVGMRTPHLPHAFSPGSFPFSPPEIACKPDDPGEAHSEFKAHSAQIPSDPLPPSAQAKQELKTNECPFPGRGFVRYEVRAATSQIRSHIKLDHPDWKPPPEWLELSGSNMSQVQGGDRREGQVLPILQGQRVHRGEHRGEGGHQS